MGLAEANSYIGIKINKEVLWYLQNLRFCDKP